MAKNKNDKLIENLIADIVNDDVEIVEKYGKKWGIRPISSKEYLSVLNKSKQYREDGATRFYGMQIEVLRYALVSLNGIELTSEQKNKLLESVSPIVVGVLYNEFERIRHSRDDKLQDEDTIAEESDDDVFQQEESENTVIDA
jgi:hypothetical protein